MADDTNDQWSVDPQGWLRSSSGAKVARIDGDRLMLYDKRDKRELPFTLDDWLELCFDLCEVSPLDSQVLFFL